MVTYIGYHWSFVGYSSSPVRVPFYFGVAAPTICEHPIEKEKRKRKRGAEKKNRKEEKKASEQMKKETKEHKKKSRKSTVGYWIWESPTAN